MHKRFAIDRLDTMYRFLRPLFFALDPERAHHLVARLLRWLSRNPSLARWLRRRTSLGDPRLRIRAFGLDFPNPVGLAAGFDKGDGLAGGLFAMGFGSVEVGTITPLGQEGNPKPRLFRLPAQQALINRMGFNNAGAEETARRYAALPFRPGPLGINLGKNKETAAAQAPEDYLRAFHTLAELGDYFVVNVSSPNTPGLRDLQAPEALRAILRPLVEAAHAAGRKPVLLKLAPDLADEAIDELADLALEEKVAGLILANTTIGRPTAEAETKAKEAGGMSGAPLYPRALELIRRIRLRVGDALPLVGVGGISRGEEVYRMIRAGARLVQVYTGFIYQGPAMVRRIEKELLFFLERDGFAELEEAVGVDAKAAGATGAAEEALIDRGP